ncbi:hypothetical protein F4781DRAFT_330264 [Annulohypoxylon bovei var. microspora]|nr:hypothetical protein F4781DRAFT_330264 [Annulohypoxylon bovei var. microspora]
MAPTKNPKSAKGAGNQKSMALASISKAKRTLPKYSSHARRSSLRLAIQESLRDCSVVVPVTTPPSSPIPSQLASLSPSPSASSLSTNIAPQRNSMRQALKLSLHSDTPTAVGITHPTTLSLPPLLLSPYSTSSSDSTPSTPSTLATTPRTPATPFSTSLPSIALTTPSTPSPSTRLGSKFASPSKGSRKPVLQRNRSRHEAEVSENNSDYVDDDPNDSEYEKDEGKSGQYARVDDASRPNANGIPTPYKGWYRVRSIVTEMRNRNGRLIYLVDWEGTDPRTGISWPSSWVESKNVSVAAIRAWEKLRGSNTMA